MPDFATIIYLLRLHYPEPCMPWHSIQKLGGVRMHRFAFGSPYSDFRGQSFPWGFEDVLDARFQ